MKAPVAWLLIVCLVLAGKTRSFSSPALRRCPTCFMSDWKEVAEARCSREARRLEGTWVATAGTFNGERWSPAKVLKFRMTFKAGRYTTTCGARTEEGAYQIEPARTLRAIDLLPANGPLAGERLEALYHLEEDRLLLCLAGPGMDRPRCFSADANSDHMLIVLRRP